MIDLKQAIKIAKEHGQDLFEGAAVSVEEFEREIYRGKEAWVITLALPRRADSVNPLSRLSLGSLEYKKFYIDLETGEMLGMKIRELANR